MSTTDPGNEGAISQAADKVEEGNEDNSYLQASRWWFASTACPLLAGTFGPLANGFSVCALVYNWRVYLAPGVLEQNGERILDPPWLIAINAVSLVAALVGNASLLLNMARRMRFSIAQPITITGFFTAGVLLIGDMAGIVSSKSYRITDPKAMAPDNHALTSAFYYAIIATSLYMIIGLLMCVTVYGANNGYYKKDFQLTPSQRTLMLQTMSFIIYLLLGALVFSKIEGWKFLDAVYWANITLLTVGLGDFSPGTKVGRGLLFPFAVGGILIVGLVIGSIRTLVLERGKEKISARITEKRRATAINNVSIRHQTIKISLFAKTDFSTDPFQPPAERRREEFEIMRKVQDAAETERRYMALAMSGGIALLLWFGGAGVFMRAEKQQDWTYFDALYFSFTSLLTIGYGDYAPVSNSGRAFYVIWSLLSVPALTILISNMGDTIVKWVTELTDWLGAITVLPDEHGIRASAKNLLKQLRPSRSEGNSFTPPGLFGMLPGSKHRNNKSDDQIEGPGAFESHLRSRLAARLQTHLQTEELAEAEEAATRHDALTRDRQFYHYVLSRECRTLQSDLNASPPKKYSWAEWEYFLKLMGNYSSSGSEEADCDIPDQLRFSSRETSSSLGTDPKTSPDQDPGPLRKRTRSWRPSRLKRRDTWTQDWSWLSGQSPLMSTRTESEWILERLSRVLERELDGQRRGSRDEPPISFEELRRHVRGQEKRKDGRDVADDDREDGEAVEDDDVGVRDRQDETGSESAKAKETAERAKRESMVKREEKADNEKSEQRNA